MWTSYTSLKREEEKKVIQTASMLEHIHTCCHNLFFLGRLPEKTYGTRFDVFKPIQKSSFPEPTRPEFLTQERPKTTRDLTRKSLEQNMNRHSTQLTINRLNDGLSMFSSLRTRIWELEETLVSLEALWKVNTHPENQNISTFMSKLQFPYLEDFSSMDLLLQRLISLDTQLKEASRRRITHGFSKKISKVQGVPRVS
ncbi:unnamed protein product [Arabis nemorensis]|uniref:Uncharacterized protein n=1 Tax=Arabis nemorensis TaxID=586526 RepID=A0A565C4E7_9BRAS|nr:unnamed protein product [Arabis nemorensis]